MTKISQIICLGKDTLWICLALLSEVLAMKLSASRTETLYLTPRVV